MKILIDNGHGFNTPGKCSPDKRLLEFKYCREIADLLVDKFRVNGYDAQRIVPETNDVSLSERCRRINNICKQYGTRNCISVSIHCNAAGNGSRWYNASGFSVYVSYNASESSKFLASLFTAYAKEMDLLGNRSIPRELYWSKDLAMCRDTLCPAVLTECMFQDNQHDVDFLLSNEGKEAIVDLHFNAIIAYAKAQLLQ